MLPEHLDPNVRWDHWGNTIVNRERRQPGELFHLPNVQQLLSEAGVLGQFERHSKYPRTMHLDWSENLQNDDRRLLTEKYFEGEEVVVTEKMDGENTTMLRDGVHARSMDSGSHPSRTWVQQLHGRIRHEIPENWRVCGENCYALHSVPYENLDGYFLLFNIWEDGKCLSWDETVSFAGMLGLSTVPVIWRGKWDRAELVPLARGIDREACEGYVVRVARAFAAHEFSRVVGKFVRRNHVRTSTHWMEGPVVVNKLAAKP